MTEAGRVPGRHYDRRASRKFRKARLVVLNRDGWRCRYCGGPANEADHRVPVRDGGTDDLGNLVAACGRCNKRRNATTHMKSASIFSGRATISPSVAVLSLPIRRWALIRGDYSRREPTDGAG